MRVSANLPPDLVEAPKLSDELEVDYDKLKMWWTRGKVRGYKRGDGRVLLSRSEVKRVVEEQERIVPMDGGG